MNLTPREINFLQRLIGHHTTGTDTLVSDLYDKLAKAAEAVGVYDDKNPLKLTLTLSPMFYGDRVIFNVEEEPVE